MLRKTFFIVAMCLVGLSAWSMGVGNKVRVGVFQGNGGAQTCIWETIASIQLDPDMTVRTITTGDIANGVLKDLDAIIIPGGEGAMQLYESWRGEHGTNKKLYSFRKRCYGYLCWCLSLYRHTRICLYAHQWWKGN